jgi:hypothetical protein
MARPIVLTSNLIPSGNQNIGALSNVYTNPDAVRRDPTVENQDGTFTIPTYQRTVIDIPDDFDFSMYGRAGPTLRYFNRVRTGEIEYDPNNDVVDLSTLTDPTDPNAPPLPSEAEMIRQELIGVGTQLAAGIGGQIGRSVAANVTGEGFDLGDISEGISEFGSEFKAMDIFRAPTGDGVAAKVRFSPTSDNAKVASLNKTISENQVSTTDALLNPEGANAARDTAKQAATTRAGLLETGDTDIFSGIRDRGKSGLFGGEATAAGRANLYGSAGAGLATVAANLIAGKNLKESVKTGAKVGAGTYVGTLIGGPIGGLIGGVLGGRVICNELMRQGIMTRKQVVLDYKFTEDYLTPQHVAGYHVWAVWMVRQMRKGRLVNFWKHVAGHRANEIAYIYGDRDKPDYLGKVYRKILEPICWSIGFFCKKTDWTVLYKQKEV